MRITQWRLCPWRTWCSADWKLPKTPEYVTLLLRNVARLSCSDLISSYRRLAVILMAPAYNYPRKYLPSMLSLRVCPMMLQQQAVAAKLARATLDMHPYYTSPFPRL